MSPLASRGRNGRTRKAGSSAGDSDTSQTIGSLLNFRPVEGESSYAPLPLEQAEAEDEQEAKASAELLGYEVEAGRWQPVTPIGDATRPPMRFVDGSVM